MELLLPLVILGGIIVLGYKTFKVVPQQEAYIIERLGKFRAVLNPGLNTLLPFFDRVAYRHSFKEIPLEVPRAITNPGSHRTAASARQNCLNSCPDANLHHSSGQGVSRAGQEAPSQNTSHRSATRGGTAEFP